MDDPYQTPETLPDSSEQPGFWRFGWVMIPLITGLLLPSLIQFWIEIRKAQLSRDDALHAVDAKWHLDYDSLASVTFTSFVPFGILTVTTLLIAFFTPSKTVSRFMWIGMALLLPIAIPSDLHIQKLIFSDNSPPFINLRFFLLVFLASLVIGTYSLICYLTILARKQTAWKNGEV